MTRRTGTILSMIFLAVLLCAGARAAAPQDSGTFADFQFAARAGFTTEITDLCGRVSSFEGVLQPASLEQHAAVGRVAAYAIRRGEDVVLSVQLHDVAPWNREPNYSGTAGSELTNGFYSVELPVGEDCTAFLTGLTPAYLTEMQEHALDAILENAVFELEDVSFIDTEKVRNVYDEFGDRIDSDADMCWAASASNVLFYTGWAEQAGFGSADYMFEALIDEFSDGGGKCKFGLQWFFNGYYQARGWKDWADDENEYDDFAGYLPDYCVSSLVETYNLSKEPAGMEAVLAGLREGCGAELSYDHYQWWEREGGHSVTLWGMVYRTGADLSEKESWTALVISDSDNDIGSYGRAGTNRRTAPNTLNLYQITPVCYAGYDSWGFVDSQKYWSATMLDDILASATLLRPYSDSLKKDEGTRNTATSPDLVADSIVTKSLDEVNYTSFFAADSKIGIYADVENMSKADCIEDITWRIVVTAPDGKAVCDETGTIGALPAGEYWSTGVVTLDALEPGVYKVSASVRTDEGEAYLANNTMTKTFYVSSRARTQDDLTFTADAVYDGVQPFSREGLRGTGRLALTYGGNLGYEVAQYSINVTYYDDEGDSLDSEYLYLGHKRPEAVFGLKPVGVNATVSVYATPEDPTLGYERLVGNADVPLTYFYIELSAERQTPSPISDLDNWLADGERIRMSFQKHANGKEDYDFLYILTAQDATTSYELDRTWITTNEFDEDDNLEWEVRGFYWYDGESEQWKPVCLPAGNYRLYVDVYYDTDSDDYYRYIDYAYIGDLTVLPSTPELTDVFTVPLGPTETGVRCTVNALAGSSFTIEVHYGTDANALDLVKSTSCDNCESGKNTVTLALDTQPETTFYYQAALLVDGKEICRSDVYSFTAPAEASLEEPTKPEPPECELLRPDAGTVALTYGEEVCYETFLPSEDGVWRVSIAGPDGTVCVWDEDAGWGEPIYFTLDGKTLDVDVRKGEPIRLRVFAYVGGDYRIGCEPDALAYRRDGEGAICLSVGEDEVCVVAAYSEEGRLLSASAAAKEGLCVFPAALDSAARVRVFRMDKTTYAPNEDAEDVYEKTLGSGSH